MSKRKTKQIQSKKKLKEKKDTKLDEKQEEILLEVSSEKVVSFDNHLDINYTIDDTLSAMDLISKSPDYSDELIKYTDPKTSENQFKLFIIAQCKREMYKLVEYSRWLDIVEKRFKQVSIDRADELSPGQIMSIIKFLKENIESSNNLINSVIKDKDITNVLIINSQTNNIGDMTRSDLLQKLYKSSRDKDESPASSRSKVVEVVTEIFKDDMSGEEISEVVDILSKNESVQEQEPISDAIVIEESQSQIHENSIEEEQVQEQRNQEEGIEKIKEQANKLSNEQIDQMLKLLQGGDSNGS